VPPILRHLSFVDEHGVEVEALSGCEPSPR
jgi:hypothetical protein